MLDLPWRQRLEPATTAWMAEVNAQLSIRVRRREELPA